MPATITDVAKLAGVSIATVSRVIHGTHTVNSEMQARVRAAIAELDYVPNSIAQSLKQNSSRMIGITASDLSVGFFPEIVKSVEKAFLPRGYATTVSSTYDSPQNEEIILRQMLARRVEILLVNSTGQNEDTLKQIASAGTPVVFYDRRPRTNAFPSVYADKKRAMQVALDHLLQVGHRRVMLVTGPRELNSNYDRYMGIQAFIFENGLEPADYTFRFGDFTPAEGFRAMEEIVHMPAERRPSAIITGSIAITAGVMAYCKKHGISIPGDIAIVSSGTFVYEDIIGAKLTYLDDSAQAMSDLIVRLIERYLNGEKIPTDYSAVLQPVLHIGESSGA